MKAAIVPVTPFQQNCSIAWCEATRRAVVIDPGGEIDRIRAGIESEGVAVEKILLTHGHIDHAGGAADLAETLGVPIEGPHRDDAFWLEALGEQGARFGVGAGRPFTPDRWLDQGDTVTVGEEILDILHCPGHTPGHVAFFCAASKLAFVGDVLFHGSVGRTDFPRGDHAALIASIRDRLWPMGDDVTFVPGHGPPSTFGHERRTNPYVAES